MTIKQIQHLLAYLGYRVGGTDGLYGPVTAGAVTAFQTDAGLEPDGEPGPATQEALRQAVCQGLPDRQQEERFWQEIRHFTPAEFACKCALYHDPYCDGYPARMDERAVRIAEKIRIHFGRPGHIVSGLRCWQHNRDSGGVANSQHMSGEAVDIRVENVDSEQILAFLKTLPEVRYAYAINGSNVHFDVPRR